MCNFKSSTHPNKKLRTSIVFSYLPFCHVYNFKRVLIIYPGRMVCSFVIAWHKSDCTVSCNFSLLVFLLLGWVVRGRSYIYAWTWTLLNLYKLCLLNSNLLETLVISERILHIGRLKTPSISIWSGNWYKKTIKRLIRNGSLITLKRSGKLIS